MNKLFTKIVGVALGLTMAIGVGVAVASNSKEASSVHAADPTAVFAATNPTAVQNQKGDITSQVGLSSTPFTATLNQNGATNAMYIKQNDFRMYGTKQTYKGNYLTISVTSAYTIKSFVFGGTTALSTAKVFKGAVSVSSNQVTGTSVTASSGTYTINSTEFTIYNNNKNVSTNTQVKFGSITITYASASIPTISVNVSPATVTLAPGETQQLTTTVLPVNTTDTLSYSSNANGVATVSSSGLITAHADGTATITATSGNYSDTCVVTVKTPTDPFIAPEKTSTSGYTGCDETIGFTYGNLTGSLSISSSNTSVVTVGSPSYADGEGTVQFNFVGAGSTTVKFYDGSTELDSVSVTVAASTVTITGLAASGSVYIGKTLDLGSTITVTATGIYSNAVTWASDDTSVATVSSAGVVTGVSAGTAHISVTSDDYPSATMSCTVTVSEAPLQYVMTFGATKNTNPTEIKTNDSYHSTYSTVDSDVVASDFSKIYGISSSQLKCGSSSASATISFTIPSSSYITSVVVVVATAGGTSMNVTSGATSAETENQTIAVGTLTFDDYLSSEKSNKVTLSSSASGAFYLTSITINYANFAPELHASLTSVEAAVNTSNQSIDLTYDYFTPTSYTATVKSGTSLTAGAVAFNTSSTPHTATFTTGSSTGATVFTITGTGGGKSASVDVTVTVTEVRNLLSLTITTPSDATSFKVGQSFDVGSLEITATFDAAPTTVIYSKAQGNMTLLTALPEIGYEFIETDIGTVTSAEFGLTVGTGTKSVSYTISVIDKDYAGAATDIRDLWDGQKVYFSNGTNAAFPKYTSGNNVTSVEATIDSTKGLDIGSTSAFAYTVGRVKIESTVYYTFSYEDGGDTYYIKDAGTSEKNAINKTTDTTDTTIYWTISAGTNSGQWHIVNRSNTIKPTLQVNDTYLSCYKDNQTDPYLYVVTPYSEEAVADAFTERYLHMDENVAGQCNTYYPILKPVWAAMGEYEKASVSGAAYERLEDWAAAHGEILDSDMNLVSASRISILGTTIQNGNTVVIIVVISMITITAIGGYYFIRKRKEN